MVIRFITLIFCLCSLNCENLLFDDSIESQPVEIYDAFIDQLDTNFPGFSYLTFDVDSLFEIHKNRLIANPSGKELVVSFQEVLNALEDANISLILSMENENVEISYTKWFTKKALNTLPEVNNYFSNYTVPNNYFEFGEISERNITYLKINNFSMGWQVDSIESFLKQLNTDGLIIDIRSVYSTKRSSSVNREATELADMFRDGSEVFIYQRYKLPNGRLDYSEWEPIWLPDRISPVYLKPVVVLTNSQTKDRAEYFTAAMRTIPNVTVVGDTTAGYFLSYWFDRIEGDWYMEGNNRDFRLPESVSEKFEGIYPDVPVWITKEDSIAGIDTILKKAIEIIKS